MMDFDVEKMSCYMKERRFAEASDYLKPVLTENTYYTALIFTALLRISVNEYLNQEENCILDISDDWQDWVRHFHSIKFLIRRLEIPHLRKHADELFAYKARYRVSDVAIRYIIEHSTLNSGEVLEIYEKMNAKAFIMGVTS